MLLGSRLRKKKKIEEARANQLWKQARKGPVVQGLPDRWGGGTASQSNETPLPPSKPRRDFPPRSRKI